MECWNYIAWLHNHWKTFKRLKLYVHGFIWFLCRCEPQWLRSKRYTFWWFSIILLVLAPLLSRKLLVTILNTYKTQKMCRSTRWWFRCRVPSQCHCDIIKSKCSSDIAISFGQHLQNRLCVSALMVVRWVKLAAGCRQVAPRTGDAIAQSWHIWPPTNVCPLRFLFQRRWHNGTPIRNVNSNWLVLIGSSIVDES